MTESIGFYIDNQIFETDESILSVKDILTTAGKSVDEFILISSDGTSNLDPAQNIEVHAGEHFTTERRDSDNRPKITYKVNGERLSTDKAILTVEEILRTAGRAASIDLNQIDRYFLENIETGEKYESLADLVEIKDKDQFLAVHAGATPVAHI